LALKANQYAKNNWQAKWLPLAQILQLSAGKEVAEDFCDLCFVKLYLSFISF
jgi:hypothetical protein